MDVFLVIFLNFNLNLICWRGILVNLRDFVIFLDWNYDILRILNSWYGSEFCILIDKDLSLRKFILKVCLSVRLFCS